MTSSSTIILDKEAIQNNWQYMRRCFGDEIKISAVVKGNAYGHGIASYIPLAEAVGVRHFSVFNAGEAYAVHEVASPGTTIMIMGAMDDKDIEWAVINDIEFYVFDMHRLNMAIEIAGRLNKKAIIHIEAETGMYRTGFDREEMPSVIETVKTNMPRLTLRGLCMHFAGAEHISNYVRLRKQKNNIQKDNRNVQDSRLAAGDYPCLLLCGGFAFS